MSSNRNKVDNPKLRQKSQNFTDYTHASQRSYKFKHSQIVKQLNLDIFKINPCNITVKHNHKLCVNYHTQKDRRRAGNFYDRNMCPHIQKGIKCPNGDSCTNCHSLVQKQYHIQVYRKCFCTHWPNTIDQCPYQQFCAYGHCQQQIQAKLIHNYLQDQDFYMFYYKTQFCILNLTQHQKHECVYAHNWQDYRRDPSIYNYQPIQCIYWNNKQMIYDYLQGCQNGAACNMCHGWKEQAYHPLYYKTIKCQEKQCRKGSCPNYHSEKEKRIIDSTFINKCFKFTPKNRIIQGVFKNHSLKQGFVPKNNHKAHTMISTNNHKKDNIFSQQGQSKSLINKKSQRTLKNSKQVHQVQWLDKQFNQSDLQDSQDVSDESLQKIQQQVQKLLN